MSFKTVLCCLVLAAGLCYAPVANSKQAGIAKRRSADKQKVLERDPRLQKPVSLERTRTTVASLLRTLTREAGVKILAEERTAKQLVCASLPQVTTKDVMDAVASLYNTTWVKTGQEIYLLKDPVPEMEGLLPKNETQRAQARAGMDFVKASEKLPPQAWKERTDTGDGYRFKFSDLPTGMQNAVRRMVEAQMDREEQEGATFPPVNGTKALPLPVSSSTLPASTVVLTKERQAGIDFYTVSVSGERGGFMMGFNNYEQLVSEKQVHRDSAATYDPDKETAAPRTIAEDTRLSQPVSLHTGDSTLARSVQVLAHKTGVPFITYGNYPFSEVRRIAISTTPLRKLLDDLTAQYPSRDWEMRNSGVVVVRADKGSRSKNRLSAKSAKRP